ncbi:MAG TPA: iron dependent repressor, metal binding and dimerization domain protein, partial [Bacillota bacterium]|jgi:Mn-dependent DtxR family transcriptional regulator|nr:iron dependent repressor, metal binding and dimerization domain protein [Bacillota bacterium]
VQEKEFRTARGYQRLVQEQKNLTPSMEDYLEMIYRDCLREGYTRVNILAERLNVQAPSASKMVQKLTEMGLLDYEKYGIIRLTDAGRELGEFLLHRHMAIEQFLANLGVRESLLAETEMIEHHFSLATLNKIIKLNQFFADHPEIHARFLQYSRQTDP